MLSLNLLATAGACCTLPHSLLTLMGPVVFIELLFPLGAVRFTFQLDWNSAPSSFPRWSQTPAILAAFYYSLRLLNILSLREEWSETWTQCLKCTAMNTKNMGMTAFISIFWRWGKKNFQSWIFILFPHCSYLPVVLTLLKTDRFLSAFPHYFQSVSQLASLCCFGVSLSILASNDKFSKTTLHNSNLSCPFFFSPI